MTGINQSKVTIVLRNPLNFSDTVDYTITPHGNELAEDWIVALKELLISKKLLEKNFCFLGFANTARSIDYLLDELNSSIEVINGYFDNYKIEEIFSRDTLLNDDPDPIAPTVKVKSINHRMMNVLHNHFERLQGTVENLSVLYKKANYETKFAIRQLNNICHELESLILSQRKAVTAPYWQRPSQITTWLNANRYDLKNTHRKLFAQNGYDRVKGGVYMHWTQIGKTLFEVFRDEGAPKLDTTTCEAITALKYYSGEFDIEWSNDVIYGGEFDWHNKEQDRFRQWLTENNLDYTDTDLSLGYMPIGQVNLKESFGTEDYQTIWNILGSHLDIYKIEVNDVSATYEYCWTDKNYKQMQIDMMKPGYDFSSRG